MWILFGPRGGVQIPENGQFLSLPDSNLNLPAGADIRGGTFAQDKLTAP